MDFHPCKLTMTRRPLLLYVDDFMSLSKIDLECLLRALMSNCKNNLLAIGFCKTKTMVFAQHVSVNKWTSAGQCTDQVKWFRYLGIMV